MPSTLTLDITGFDYEARGVARHDGKTHFVSGALPGERVTARVLESKKREKLALKDKIYDYLRKKEAERG